MAASRLKGKPLLEINNIPIICHVLNKAMETGLEVIVATEDKEIVTAVEQMVVVKSSLQEIIKLELIEFLKLLKS